MRHLDGAMAMCRCKRDAITYFRRSVVSRPLARMLCSLTYAELSTLLYAGDGQLRHFIADIAIK